MVDLVPPERALQFRFEDGAWSGVRRDVASVHLQAGQSSQCIDGDHRFAGAGSAFDDQNLLGIHQRFGGGIDDPFQDSLLFVEKNKLVATFQHRAHGIGQLF